MYSFIFHFTLMGLSFAVFSCSPRATKMEERTVPSSQLAEKQAAQVEQQADFFINSSGDTIYYLRKSEEEWRKQLNPEQYHILRQAGTERAFTGLYYDHHGKGIYRCAACGLPLFSSEAKFDSGTGWPSYYQPIDPTHIREVEDNSYGMHRIELRCARCDGHLGHVFPDGPKPTGLRYCINSASLKLEQQ